MRALCLLRDNIAYRKDAYLAGLEATGFEVVREVPKKLWPDDLLVIWNRYGQMDETARQYEQAGARVIVTENGHLGKKWPNGPWFSMCLNHHAGAGTWTYGGPNRWDTLNYPLRRWKDGGNELIVLAQRGIGEHGLRSPANWHEHMVARLLQKNPELKVRVRQHPATGAILEPLEKDLANSAGVVTWHSAAALEALSLGVPVWYDCESWIGRKAGRPVADLVAGLAPMKDDATRLNVFRHVAWAMWTLDEIQRGDAFRHLLGMRERVAA